jgi:hypothetical protein
MVAPAPRQAPPPSPALPLSPAAVAWIGAVKSDRRVGRLFALARAIAARAGADVQIDVLAGDLRARPEEVSAGVVALEMRGWLAVAAGAKLGRFALTLQNPRRDKKSAVNAAPLLTAAG